MLVIRTRGRTKGRLLRSPDFFQKRNSARHALNFHASRIFKENGRDGYCFYSFLISHFIHRDFSIQYPMYSVKTDTREVNFMKCDKCGGSDSFSSIFFVDRNGNYFSDTELEAFKVLHPEVRDENFYQKVVLCGFCQFEVKKEWLKD